MFNKEEINKTIKETETTIEEIREISDNLVDSYTKSLDDLMKEINEEIVAKDNPSDTVIEKYFTELTNAIYFIGAKSEFFGFYEDVSKYNMKLKYDEGYSQNIEQGLLDTKKKPTVAENEIAANKYSINETIVNFIYSRSFRIIRTKVEAANEMIKTLSKLLSKHMQEMNLSGYNIGTGEIN